MLLILSHERDQIAGALAARCAGDDARVVTCRDLTSGGWRYDPRDPAAARAVVGGRAVHAREIKGVLVRLPAITADYLPHIAAADRGYVAAELTAFLTAWLSGAPFPVLNRPTPTCLMGPNWRREQWLHAAWRAGMRVVETAYSVKPSSSPEVPGETAFADGATVNVVGDRCLGRADEKLAAQARRLAAEAGAELLAVEFSSPAADARFVGAYLGPDVSRPDVADALLENFKGRALAAV